MKHFLIFFLLLYTHICGESETDIIECLNIKDLDSVIDKDTLVLLDIDNTILHAKGNLGKVEWQDWLILRYQDWGLNKEDSYNIATDQWNRSQEHIEVVLVEKALSKLFSKWQTEATLLCLTARDPALSKVTENQLLTIGLTPKNHPFDIQHLLLSEHTLFQNGVIYCGSRSKGEAIQEFLTHVAYKAKRVVFADDRQHNVESVAKIMKEQQIPYTGFHYKYCQENCSEEFNALEATLDWARRMKEVRTSSGA